MVAPITRKVQEKNGQMIITIPKAYANLLDLEKHEVVEFYFNTEEQAIIIKKVKK